jgi:hypothetical protein
MGTMFTEVDLFPSGAEIEGSLFYCERVLNSGVSGLRCGCNPARKPFSYREVQLRILDVLDVLL